MKKLLFLVMTMLCFSTIKAIETDSIISGVEQKVSSSIAYVDTSSTFKMFYSDVVTGVSTLAAGLKVGAEHVYAILVKQQIANSITFLILGLIGTFMLFSYINKYKTAEIWLDRYDTPTMLGVVRTIQLIAGFALLLITLLNLNHIVMGFINPEYGAIQEIIKLIK